VYGIVKQSGGYVWAYSEKGKGTSFRVYLPRVYVEANGTLRAATGVQAPPGSETILLVEDDEAVRAMAKRVLDRDGYRVLEARSGVEALQVCEESEGAIDLIVTDLVMPGLGGRDLAAHVRAQYPGARILFMSGYTEEAALQRSVLSSSESFLSKPFTPDVLARRVRELLDAGAEPGVRGGAYPAPSGNGVGQT
jgi:CheY-like chemotaxis protein